MTVSEENYTRVIVNITKIPTCYPAGSNNDIRYAAVLKRIFVFKRLVYLSIS